jgi:hypothetical protein
VPSKLQHQAPNLMSDIVQRPHRLKPFTHYLGFSFFTDIPQLQTEINVSTLRRNQPEPIQYCTDLRAIVGDASAQEKCTECLQHNIYMQYRVARLCDVGIGMCFKAQIEPTMFRELRKNLYTEINVLSV